MQASSLRTSLHQAAREGRKDVVDFVLSRGDDPESRTQAASLLPKEQNEMGKEVVNLLRPTPALLSRR